MIGGPLVIDASVACAFIFNEPDRASAQRLFEARARKTMQLVAPSWWSLECGAACWKRVRRGWLSQSEALEANEAFGALAVVLLDTSHLTDIALEVAIHAKISVYDALYVATAEYVGGTLITADRKLIDSLRSRDWPTPVLHINELAA